MTTKATTLPQAEGSFAQFVRNLLKQLQDHPDVYKLPDSEVQELAVDLNDWLTKVDNATTARDAAKAATEAKDAARSTVDEKTRTIVRILQADPSVSDDARLEAGIRPHKTSRTPVPPPHTTPIGNVMATDRLEHTLFFSDAATPTKKARPAGVNGCEIYVCVADVAPTDPKQYRMIRFATRTPDTITFDAEDGGKNANYLLRWINTKGETGPWSQVVSATIPAV